MSAIGVSPEYVRVRSASGGRIATDWGHCDA
jgi:hypothetical protein